MARTVTSGSSGRGTAVEGIGLDDGRCAAGGLTPRGRSVTMTVVRATAVEVPTRVLVFGMLAAVMVLTRKLDWTALSLRLATRPAASP